MRAVAGTTGRSGASRPPRALRARLAGWLQRGLTRHGELVFAPLRRYKPVAGLGGRLWLTRHEDVRRVLSSDEAFHVTYGEKMEAVTGPFVLGYDDGPSYRFERAALRAAIRPDDLPRLAELTRSAAEERLEGARGARIDIVGELCDPVLDATVTAYFGTPAPDAATQVKRARAVFRAVFLDPQREPGVLEEGRSASAGMQQTLATTIASRRARLDRGEPAPDDVLTRLLAGPLDDQAIARNFIGLISAWITSVSRATALAVDELLTRPDALAGARQAATAGDADLVAAHLLEALRFQPQNPLLVRTCAADVVVAPGARRERRVRAGTTVVAVTQSAMMDPHWVEDPLRFRTDRPATEYLHFGVGMHTCLGAQISRVQMGAIGVALLRRGDVRRADALRWSGPYPTGLRVQLE